MAALVKETHWKPEYIVWELPCAYLFLLLDFWPKIETKDGQEKDVSEFSNLKDLGIDYAG